MSKSHWHNIPVIHGEGQSQAVQIHEAYFDAQGRLTSWTKGPVAPCGDTVEELRCAIRMQLNDAEKYLPRHISKLSVGMTIPEKPAGLDITRSIQKRTLRSGRVEYTIQLTISDSSGPRDIWAMEFDRRSLSSFQKARLWSDGVIRGFNACNYWRS